MEKQGVLAALPALRSPEAILVTRPSMPPLADYVGLLEGIWKRRWLTNDGELHQQLEARLSAFLGVQHLSLFNNGATALLTALQALGVNSGEVITTPFTFPATAHSLVWNRVKPTFCDIEEHTFNLDPARVEGLIGPETRAILAVHVYGNPCAVDRLQAIADRHKLLLIYDAAHAFGVKLHGKPLVGFGDMSMLSFHATKVFSTVEGGALISASAAMRLRVNSLKNFGIASPELVTEPGINGKMNELQAAFGLLGLEMFDAELAKRAAGARAYRRLLGNLPGLELLQDLPGVTHNYGYFPVLIDARKYGLNRDQLHDALRELNVFTRKYFYPLVTRVPCYASLPSANPELLPVAERVASQVLCLPIHGSLRLDQVEMICEAIRRIPGVLG